MLDVLARTPFAERDELAAFAGLPKSSTLESLLGLEARGMMAYVRHTRTNTSRVRRWYLPPRGITRLAELQEVTSGRLLRELPLSAEWRRRLLRRLDTVAPLYRVGREVAQCADGPINWRWMRSGALDALLELPDGRTLALLRFGPTLSWQAMRSRIGTLYWSQRARRLPSGAAPAAREPRGAAHSGGSARQGGRCQYSVGERRDAAPRPALPYGAACGTRGV